jgi:hypothetical protein
LSWISCYRKSPSSFRKRRSIFRVVAASYDIHPGADGLNADVSRQDKMVADFFQGFKPLSTAHWRIIMPWIIGILAEAESDITPKFSLIPPEARRSSDLGI